MLALDWAEAPVDETARSLRSRWPLERAFLRRLWCLAAAGLLGMGCEGTEVRAVPTVPVRVERLLDAPIIHAGTHESIGANIQGPSLIRVPDWIPDPLGRYYLYFADHKGRYIRLAYADELVGPWTVHAPGSLRLEESGFPTELPEPPAWRVAAFRLAVEASGVELATDPLEEMTTAHVASPDVHLDPAGRRIVMYFHGLEDFAHQVTRVATSSDGIHFEAQPQILGKTYLRAFEHAGRTYAMSMPGQLYRSADGLTEFQEGPLLFGPDMRHAALVTRGNTLHVFWTRVGDAPERILHSTIDLSPPWEEWIESAPREILRPERDWEGADAPREPSMRSVAPAHVNQLRDPAIYQEGGRTFLLYAVAGEAGIAIAELHGLDAD